MRHRRNEFTKETQRRAFDRCRGRCESARVPSLADIGCNRELRTGDINYDHISADAISGDNSLDNCAVLCKSCHGIKTREHDVPAIAQDKRVFDLDKGIRDPWRQRLPGGREDDVKIKVRGRRVVYRLTGEPRGWGR